jgi:DNA invertase Pin-like site-specific DNA recombinase
MKIATYTRVSTSEQTVENQVQALRQYCQQRGWQIAREYSDEGISGAKSDRPELNRLMVDAGKRKFDAVCVWKFDRFGRSTQHLLKSLETFRSLGIEFVSVSESIDTSSAAGKMLFTMLAAFAEFERGLIIERTHAGLRRARAEGRRAGPKAKEVNGERVRQLRAEGVTWREVCEITGLSKGGAFRALQRRGSDVVKESLQISPTQHSAGCA